MTANNENRVELLVLLSEPIAASGRFEQAELDYILGKAEDIYQAAALGWRLKADKIVEAGGLVQSLSMGSERVQFASISDTLAYCESRAKMYEAKSMGNATAALMLSFEAGSIGPEIETADDEA